MLKIIRFNLLLISFCFVLFFADSAKAQTYYPEGSYRQTCQDVSIKGYHLVALCKPKSGSIETTPYTKLYEFYLCDGDISNNDGTLVCNKNQNSALMQKAKTNIKSSYKKHFGREMTESVNPWLREFFKANKDASNYFYLLGTPEKVFSKFMGDFLRQADQGKYRMTLISNVFADVYGKEPNPTDVAFWSSEITKGKGFYEEIFAAEAKKLNSNKINRRFMVTAAYKKSLGRAALSKELDFWDGRLDIFSEIVKANRIFLYSSKGAKDLTETIERSFYTKTGEKPTAKQINEAIIKYTKTKAIYSEM